MDIHFEFYIENKIIFYSVIHFLMFNFKLVLNYSRGNLNVIFGEMSMHTDIFSIKKCVIFANNQYATDILYILCNYLQLQGVKVKGQVEMSQSSSLII